MLQVADLHATIGGKEFLKGLSLAVGAGEAHAIMGPNGAGKSTLSCVPGGSVMLDEARHAHAMTHCGSQP